MTTVRAQNVRWKHVAGALATACTALTLPGCGIEPAASEEAFPSGVLTQRSALTTLHPLGAGRDPAAMMDAKRVSAAGPAGPLPSAVDLSANFPLPGDQASMGSCVGWAVGYAAKTFHESVAERWPADFHQFSPSWVYNQINGRKDDGAFVSDAMNLIVNKGADNLDDFPYVDGDFTTQPDVTSMGRADRYHAKSWNTLTVSTTEFKKTLAGGQAIVVAFEVMSDFDELNTSTNLVYDTDVSTYQTPTHPSRSRGRHAVAVIGYDDARGAFRIINSWGRSFAGGGYSWIGYSFITNANLAMDAYVLNDGPNRALSIGPANHSLDYFPCAKEGATCVLGGPKYVAFGANGAFLFKSVNGSVPCNGATFGGDLAPNRVKACYFANYQFQLQENVAGRAFIGTGDIAYGANGVFNFKTLVGNYTCNNATFGDPTPGVAKACYSALPGYTPSVAEGGTISGTGIPVAFGANGKFILRVLNGSMACSNDAFGFDPAPNVPKNCYKYLSFFAADEGGSYSSQGTAYFGSGANGNFLSTVQRSGVCSVATFGGDPEYGRVKQCYGSVNP